MKILERENWAKAEGPWPRITAPKLAGSRGTGGDQFPPEKVFVIILLVDCLTGGLFG
jgi:hypothetical protein